MRWVVLVPEVACSLEAPLSLFLQTCKVDITCMSAPGQSAQLRHTYRYGLAAIAGSQGSAVDSRGAEVDREPASNSHLLSIIVASNTLGMPTAENHHPKLGVRETAPPAQKLIQ